MIEYSSSLRLLKSRYGEIWSMVQNTYQQPRCFVNLHLIKSLALSEVFISPSHYLQEASLHSHHFYNESWVAWLNKAVTEDREGLEDDIELLIDMLDAFNFSLAFAVAFYK